MVYTSLQGFISLWGNTPNIKAPGQLEAYQGEGYFNPQPAEKWHPAKKGFTNETAQKQTSTYCFCCQ